MNRSSERFVPAARRALGLVALLALGACGDALGPTTPAVPPDGPSSAAGVLYTPVRTVAVSTCTVVMSPLSVSCVTPLWPTTGPPTQPTGGSGVSTRLVVTSPTYNAVTDTLSMNVRIQNLLVNPIGTQDGVDTTGLNAFFFQNPQRTGGSGSVLIGNADGTSTFTQAGQRYYFYDMALPSMGLTPIRPWKFVVPGTVTGFTFKIYVTAQILPVVFFDMAQGGNRDIWRVALDGSGLTRVTDEAAVDMDPWVTQKKLYYVSYRNGNADVYSLPIGATTATNPTLLHGTLANETQPAVSFDEQLMVFINDISGTPKLWKSGVTGVNPVPYTQGFGTGASIESYPAFNPARNVVFGTTHRGVGTELFIRKPTKIENAITGNWLGMEPAVSQDGKRIAFTSTRDGDTELYFWNSATLTTTRLTTRAGIDATAAFTPEVSPYRLVYVEYGPTATLKWRTLTGAATTIPTPAAARNPSVVPAF